MDSARADTVDSFIFVCYIYLVYFALLKEVAMSSWWWWCWSIGSAHGTHGHCSTCLLHLCVRVYVCLRYGSSEPSEESKQASQPASLPAQQMAIRLVRLCVDCVRLWRVGYTTSVYICQATRERKREVDDSDGAGVAAAAAAAAAGVR